MGPAFRRAEIGALILAAVAASTDAGCNRAPKATATPPPQVEVATVVERDTPIYREWTGTTVGYVTAQIRPRVTGYLLARNYREGTVVKAGDLLFTIDPRPYQNSLDQAKGKLTQSESQLFSLASVHTELSPSLHSDEPVLLPDRGPMVPGQLSAGPMEFCHDGSAG